MRLRLRTTQKKPGKAAKSCSDPEKTIKCFSLSLFFLDLSCFRKEGRKEGREVCVYGGKKALDTPSHHATKKDEVRACVHRAVLLPAIMTVFRSNGSSPLFCSSTIFSPFLPSLLLSYAFHFTGPFAQVGWSKLFKLSSFSFLASLSN